MLSRSRVNSSSAPNGSSRSSSSAPVLRSRASATRCCMPPERWRGKANSKPVEAGELEELDRALAVGVADAAGEHRRQEDVVERRLPVEEGRPLEHHADLGAAARRPRSPNAVSVPDVLRDEAGDEAQERRLAAAGRADQGDELAAADGEARVLERDDGAGEDHRGLRRGDHRCGRRRIRSRRTRRRGPDASIYGASAIRRFLDFADPLVGRRRGGDLGPSKVR